MKVPLIPINDKFFSKCLDPILNIFEQIQIYFKYTVFM